MSGATPVFAQGGRAALGRRPARTLGARVLVCASVLVVLLVLVLPLAVVCGGALEKGALAYFAALVDDETLSAVRLTLLVAAVSVTLNVVFGVAAAWLLAKYDFWGKSALITLIDLPFSVSPVIAGLIFVLLFGSHGAAGPWLSNHGIKIVFALPGIVLATTFITFPMVARELLAVMQAQGSDEEEAALVLGATGAQILWKITLPKVRWGLLYGVILCNARAMGEFGAVSVVSGHIRGVTNTMPLQIEILYNEYRFAAAFAVASLLALLAVLTLFAKKMVERMYAQPSHREPEAREPARSEAPARAA